jgi:hypothetical protein
LDKNFDRSRPKIAAFLASQPTTASFLLRLKLQLQSKEKRIVRPLSSGFIVLINDGILQNLESRKSVAL